MLYHNVSAPFRRRSFGEFSTIKSTGHREKYASNINNLMNLESSPFFSNPFVETI